MNFERFKLFGLIRRIILNRLYPILFMLIISFCEIGHYSMLLLQEHHEISDMSTEENNEKEGQEKKIEDLNKQVEDLAHLALIGLEEYDKLKRFSTPKLEPSQFDQSIQLPPPELF